MHEDSLHQAEANINSNCFTWSRTLKKMYFTIYSFERDNYKVNKRWREKIMPYQKLKYVNICLGKNQHWGQLNQYFGEKDCENPQCNRESQQGRKRTAVHKQKIKTILINLIILKKIKLN